MFKSHNTTQVLIGKSISRTSSVVVGDSNNASYLADGEVVVLDENDAVLTPGDTLADTKYIRVVQRSGAAANPQIMSNRIYGPDVINFQGTSFSAFAEQLYYIGYNGTSGDIDSTGSEDYVLRITFKQDKDLWSQQANTRIYHYRPTSATTTPLLFDSFAKQVADDKFAADDITIERVSDGTFTVLGGASTLAVVRGSKTAIASAAGHNLAVGDYVRIGGTGSTVAIYKVSAVNTTTITLDQPFQGTSATVANANVGEMSVQTVYGLKITGRALAFTVGKLKWQKVKFDISLSNWGTTLIDKNTESNVGLGEGEQVAELEWFANGFEGMIDRVGDSAPTVKADTDASLTYDIIAIEYNIKSTNYTVAGSQPARALLYLCMVVDAAQTADVLGQLNPWMASLPKGFSNVAV